MKETLKLEINSRYIFYCCATIIAAKAMQSSKQELNAECVFV